MAMHPPLDHLAERVTNRLAGSAPSERLLIGIVGSPGAGKTTLAGLLVDRLTAALGSDLVRYLPLDGYHLADVELDRLGLRDRKGAPQTFDVFGYLALLRRVRENADPVVYAPGFDRTIEQPIAGSLPVSQSARVIITEGNYLLLDGDWSAVRPLLDEVWFCRPDEALRLERLEQRHIRFGKSAQGARAWIERSDQPNAELIAATIDRADLIIDLS